MTTYPIEFHRRLEQKWASRIEQILTVTGTAPPPRDPNDDDDDEVEDEEDEDQPDEPAVVREPDEDWPLWDGHRIAASARAPTRKSVSPPFPKLYPNVMVVQCRRRRLKYRSWMLGTGMNARKLGAICALLAATLNLIGCESSRDSPDRQFQKQVKRAQECRELQDKLVGDQPLTPERAEEITKTMDRTGCAARLPVH